MDQRHFHRILFTAEGDLRQGRNVWPTTLLDLSLRGALVTKPLDFDGDTERLFILRFSLEGLEAPIVMEGVIAHEESATLGLAAVHTDIDSATALRRIIELNLGNPDLLQRDLHALLQFAGPMQ